MPIRIDIPYEMKENAKSMGAWWLADEKSWVIPDLIKDINPFAEWLPDEEGYIVKSPQFIVRSSRVCWKCNRETPLIALGARSLYRLEYEAGARAVWTQLDIPVMFIDIHVMDQEITSVLLQRYPFFQLTNSKTAGGKYWGNTCIHCHSLQGDNFNFMEYNGIFSFSDEAQASFVKVERLKMTFSYYISSSLFLSESNEWLLR